ncbi:hypothetical protein [Collimonas arenae]|uniref:hypothetical protein n=1 Tax=Collimonas arenae TaxID=279058 RepID=UPI00056EE263|nr:hypothetical protein [Collimonas arenae]
MRWSSGKKLFVRVLLFCAAFSPLIAYSKNEVVDHWLEPLFMLLLLFGSPLLVAWLFSKAFGRNYMAQHFVAIGLCIFSVIGAWLAVPIFFAPVGVLLSISSWFKFKRQMDQKGETGYWRAGLLNALPLVCTIVIVSFEYHMLSTERWN